VLTKLFTKDYDNNAFSIFYLRYQKLATEKEEFWLAENFRNFFIQKIDSNRKYAFGNLGIYGAEGDYEVRGVWLVRGKGVPQFLEQLTEHWDKKELHHTKTEDANLINEYWLNAKKGDTVENLPVADNVWFK